MFDRYKVKKGEDLKLIAHKFGTEEEYLRNINDIYYLDHFYEGMDIIVPRAKDLYYEVMKTNESGKIVDVARKYNINPVLFANLNGLEADDYIYENQEIIIPKKNYSYYIVKEGDSILNVSQIFNISKERLLAHNETIYLLPGQILVNKKNI